MKKKQQISLCGICVMRNEEDIVELFVKHNLKYLDFLICFDNESQDKTLSILLSLKNKGFPIEVLKVQGLAHPQITIANSAINSLKNQFDVFFFLDADEFIIANTSQALTNFASELIAEEKAGLISWVLGIPDLENSYHQNSICLDVVLQSDRSYQKVCGPSLLFQKYPELSLLPGFHGFIANNWQENYKNTQNIFLLHIPCRTKEQFVSKCICGEIALKLNPRRIKGEGYHWKYIYDLYRNKQEISIEDILSILTNVYLRTSLEECNIMSLDFFELIEDITLVESNNPKKMGIELTILNNCCFSVIESLEKTKFSNVNTCVGQLEYGVVCYDKQDTVIGKSIEIYGEWASEELTLLQNWIKPGDTVIDVGANIGVHTLRFAQLVGKMGRVFAFEPQRLVYQKLCSTIALNNIDNVIAYNYGIGEEETKVEVKSMIWGNLGNFSIERASVNNGDEIIEIKTLDSFSLQKCNLIKIDVEGMEKKVLNGAIKTIKNFLPILFVENNIQEKSESLLKFIMSLEYDCWWHFASYYNENNFYQNSYNIFANVGRPEINVLCLPKKWQVQVPKLIKISTPQDSPLAHF